MPARRYLVLLRAINVGGRTVTMERLRAVLTTLGFPVAATFIQSGNVFLESTLTDRARLTRTLESGLAEALGFDVPVFVRTLDELAAITTAPAFAGLRLREGERAAVIFTSAPPPPAFQGSHTSRENFDVLQVTAGELFIVWRPAGARPGNPGAFVEKTLGLKTTTRFHHTLCKMQEAALRAWTAPRSRR